MNSAIARLAIAPTLGLLALAWIGLPQQKPSRKGDSAVLHSGWRVTPYGTSVELGDQLVGITLSPDKRLFALASAGASEHCVMLVDAETGTVVRTVKFSRVQNGLAWTSDGSTLFISGGPSNQLHRLDRQKDGSYAAGTSIELPKGTGAAAAAWYAGLAAMPDGSRVYVANLKTDELLAIDPKDGSVAAKHVFADEGRPYAVKMSNDGNRLFVGLMATSEVAVVNPQTLDIEKTFKVGRHPNDILEVGSRLFVSCGNDDTVYVLDSTTGDVQEKIVTRLTPTAPPGSTPNALAVSPDGKTLFVALADNNSVAVVDIEEPHDSKVEGFIPTGWYPTSVAAFPDGKRLLIGAGKGMGTGANPVTKLPIDPNAPTGYTYIVKLLSGLLTVADIPTGSQLGRLSRQVLANSPYRDANVLTPARAPRPGSNAIPSRQGDPSPIQHVLYIIKENRTYDQVLGDLKDSKGRAMGNGDPNLTLFGEDVSPNHHELARQFVLLDNLYCNGEVSVDGHHWTNGAYVPDFMQRTWPQQYSGKGTPPLNTGLSDTPSGRLWDLAERAGLPYKTYYYHTKKNQNAEWAKARAAGRRDYDYIDIFIKDFQKMDQQGTVPRLMVMALSEDHTSGTRPGSFTPKACVASNDLALGKLVEAISKSKVWDKFAIFVIEDDAQNGPDHVDAHRTVGLVISPYTKRQYRDNTWYTTVSFLRTMEMILGLPPMSQYDAGATVMYNAFSDKPDLTPYTCRPARIDLEAKNSSGSYGAAASMKLDFSQPDMLTEEDEQVLNRVLWHSVKGAKTPFPGITRRALIGP